MSGCGCGGQWVYKRAPCAESSGCERPGMIICDACARYFIVRCGASSRAKCGPCSEVKRGDIKRIGRSGFDRPGDYFGLLTLTGPGRDELPWDTDVCGHAEDGSQCSGVHGCTVQRVPSACWHRTLARRWSWFVTYLRREVGDVQYLKVYEWQRRGVVHVHALIRVRGAVSQRRLLQAIRQCSDRWAFGAQVDVRWISATDAGERARAAGYSAKYVTKCDELGQVPTIDFATGEVGVMRLRSWSASGEWGDTMRECSMRRQAFCDARAGLSGSLRAGPVGPTAPAGPALTCRPIVPQPVAAAVWPSVVGAVTM